MHTYVHTSYVHTYMHTSCKNELQCMFMSPVFIYLVYVYNMACVCMLVYVYNMIYKTIKESCKGSLLVYSLDVDIVCTRITTPWSTLPLIEHTHIRACVYMHKHMSMLRKGVLMSMVYIYIYIYIHTYTHTHTHTRTTQRNTCAYPGEIFAYAQDAFLHTLIDTCAQGR